MTILVVTQLQVLPNFVKMGPIEIHFRTATSGLKCLAADWVVLGPGLSNEQRALAAECSLRGYLCK